MIFVTPDNGRLWQSRVFWEAVDKALGAAGELARLHDDYTGAIADPAAVAPAALAVAPGPLVVTITWPDGTTTAVRQPTPGGTPEPDPRPARPPGG